jgi:hypothetical protein
MNDGENHDERDLGTASLIALLPQIMPSPMETPDESKL